MNDNERKDVKQNMPPVSDLNDRELVREIARRLGSYILPRNGEYVVFIDHVEVKTYAKIGWALKHLFANIPNWPQDDGAAFRLVRDVVDQLNTLEKRRWHTWTMSYALGGFMLVLDNEDDRTLIEYTATGETARALSELAALALRQMGDPALTGKRD